MNINSDLLKNSKVNGIFYANDFKCKNLCDGLFESGNISDTGVETSSTSTYRSINYYEVEGGGTYICSYTATSGTNLNWAACYTENKTFITRLTGLAKNPFKVPSNTKYVRLGFYKASGISSSDFSNVQLEYGSTITPYTIYRNFENDDGFNGVKRITDFDTTVEAGVYQFTSGVSNLPSMMTTPYGNLYVGVAIVNGEKYIQQVAIDNNENIGMRTYHPSTKTWKVWTQVRNKGLQYIGNQMGYNGGTYLLDLTNFRDNRTHFIKIGCSHYNASHYTYLEYLYRDNGTTGTINLINNKQAGNVNLSASLSDSVLTITNNGSYGATLTIIID